MGLLLMTQTMARALACEEYVPWWFHRKRQDVMYDAVFRDAMWNPEAGGQAVIVLRRLDASPGVLPQQPGRQRVGHAGAGNAISVVSPAPAMSRTFWLLRGSHYETRACIGHRFAPAGEPRRCDASGPRAAARYRESG